MQRINGLFLWKTYSCVSQEFFIIHSDDLIWIIFTSVSKFQNRFEQQKNQNKYITQRNKLLLFVENECHLRWITYLFKCKSLLYFFNSCIRLKAW